MRTKALYFPYINLPSDDWLPLMLLYWDQLSSIVPYEYISHPERLSPHMPRLVGEGLVNLLSPQEYIQNMDDFGRPFLNYVRRQKRRRYLVRRQTFEPISIHVEKLGNVADELVRLNLATSINYPLFNMEPWVANAFMSYLATILGSLPEVDSIPITNNAQCFRLLRGNTFRFRDERTLQRQLVLEHIFPLPKSDLDIKKLVKFKKNNHDKLARFRYKIEGISIDLSNIHDNEYRDERRQIFIREIQEEIDDISIHMREMWPNILLSGVVPIAGLGCSIIAGAMGNQPLAAGLAVYSLPKAIWEFSKLQKNNKDIMNRPLAYGAILNSEWLRLIR